MTDLRVAASSATPAIVTVIASGQDESEGQPCNPDPGVRGYPQDKVHGGSGRIRHATRRCLSAAAVLTGNFQRITVPVP